jgi:CheY-like chemotaxis protein
MKPVCILVVDDEADLELLFIGRFKARLKQGEFRFVFARHGGEALERLQQHPDIAVAFIDINMPHMDGFTLLSHLKEEHPLVCPVVISAYHDMPNIRKAMNCGGIRFSDQANRFCRSDDHPLQGH